MKLYWLEKRVRFLKFKVDVLPPLVNTKLLHVLEVTPLEQLAHALILNADRPTISYHCYLCHHDARVRDLESWRFVKTRTGVLKANSLLSCIPTAP